MVILETTHPPDDNEQHMFCLCYYLRRIFYAKNKFQDVVFTIIMATIMVYGMVVYNVALNTGTVMVLLS